MTSFTPTTRVTIKTFGFARTDPPADATIVLDCRHLEDSVSSPAAYELLARALKHVSETPGAVVAFGCQYGEVRSVLLAARLGQMLNVVPEQHRKRGAA